MGLTSKLANNLFAANTPPPPTGGGGDPLTGIVSPKGPANGPYGSNGIFGALGNGIRTAVQQAQNTANSLIPDNYAATLRSIARSRTQMMMRNSNGQAGSAQGIV